MRRPKSILFVCLGNICRSPAANGVLEKLLSTDSALSDIFVDSCGTGDWHIGQLPDARMRNAGKQKGYSFTHRARTLLESDYTRFDCIIAMDESNRNDILARAPKDFDISKLMLCASFCDGKFAGKVEVPDPYYGTDKDFEYSLEMIENACNVILKKILQSGL